MTMPRQTHTVVQLEVPLTFWQFVQQKFIDAGYQHAFGSDSGSEPFIDMSGVAITPIPGKPIDMVLHCPVCGEQHIDEPEMCVDEGCEHHGGPHTHPGLWMNPPHRSHQCHCCGYIWRPADVCTNGVEKVKTTGKADSTEEDRKKILKSIAESGDV